MKFAREARMNALMLTVMFVLGIGVTQSAEAQAFTVLYNFTGSSDGGNPLAGVVRDAKGNLYGTTIEGGNFNCNSYLGCGVVFKLSTTGTETVLHSFNGTDGNQPEAGLIRDAAGNLYGTTFNGGAFGVGTVFKVDTSGTESVLHSFTGGSADGCYPLGGLLRDKAGNLYGTTFACGSGDTGFLGTVFKVDTSGTESVLHNFAGGATDGGNPYFTSLLMDAKGNLYGVTEKGGSSDEGVVYKLSKSGKLTVLHSFSGFSGGTADGCQPYGTPAMDKSGNIYGTTVMCGSSNLGIVWKVSQQGTESVLHNFTGQPKDGAYPYAGLIMDAKGNLYGETEQGGLSNCSYKGCGTVFKIDPTGKETVLHKFNLSHGDLPFGGVLRDKAGNLYGTTFGGGSSGTGCGGFGCGTVFKLTP